MNRSISIKISFKSGPGNLRTFPISRDRLYATFHLARDNGRYGLHLFGKIRLAKVEDAFIHVRLFVTEEGAKVHSIQTEKKEEGGKSSFTAIFREKDPLEWFNE